MAEIPESSDLTELPARQSAPAAGSDVWHQLGEFASGPDADPVLRLLIGEALSSQVNLHGVTVALANRYRALIDAVPDAITIHDETGRVLDANVAASEIYGLERESLLKLSIGALNPELSDDFLHGLRTDFGSSTTATARSTIHKHNGSSTTVELHAHVYLDSGHRRIIAVTRDLGPRQVADDQLYRSESALRLLIHSMDKGVVVRDERGHILSCNPSASRILQISAADLVAMRSDQLAQWRFFDKTGSPLKPTELPWARALRTGKPTESAICGFIVPGQRAIRWLSITAVPRTPNESNRPLQVVSIFADVTASHRDAMLFAHAQVLNNIGAWQLEFGNDILLWSAHMHVIFDLPETTPITLERMLSHFSGNDLDRLRQAFRATRTGESTDLEVHMTTAIGRRRKISIRLRALQRDDEVQGVIGSVQDITARESN